MAIAGLDQIFLVIQKGNIYNLILFFLLLLIVIYHGVKWTKFFGKPMAILLAAIISLYAAFWSPLTTLIQTFSIGMTVFVAAFLFVIAIFSLITKAEAGDKYKRELMRGKKIWAIAAAFIIAMLIIGLGLPKEFELFKYVPLHVIIAIILFIAFIAWAINAFILHRKLTWHKRKLKI